MGEDESTGEIGILGDDSSPHLLHGCDAEDRWRDQGRNNRRVKETLRAV